MSKHSKERKQKAVNGFTVPEDFTSYLSSAQAEEDSFGALVEILLGRSVPDRKIALCKTASLLEYFCLGADNWTVKYQSTLFDVIKRSLRFDDQEKILGAKIAALYVCCDPSVAETLCKELRPLFEGVLTADINSEAGPEVIKAWGTLLFMDWDDSPDVIPIFDIFFQWLLDTENIALQISILETFGFCFSYLSTNQDFIDVIATKYVPEIETIFLTTPDPFLQKAAAQTIAVMVGIEKYDVITEDVDCVIQDSFSLNEIGATLDDCLQNRISGISKDEQKAIRRSIKECLKVVRSESDESVYCPEEVRDFDTFRVEAKIWRDVVQLRWLIGVVRGGAKEHFWLNKVFVNYFTDNIVEQNSGRLSVTQKRETKFLHSESDKSRTKARRKTQRTTIILGE